MCCFFRVSGYGLIFFGFRVIIFEYQVTFIGFWVINFGFWVIFCEFSVTIFAFWVSFLGASGYSSIGFYRVLGYQFRVSGYFLRV